MIECTEVHRELNLEERVPFRERFFVANNVDRLSVCITILNVPLQINKSNLLHTLYSIVFSFLSNGFQLRGERNITILWNKKRVMKMERLGLGSPCGNGKSIDIRLKFDLPVQVPVTSTPIIQSRRPFTFLSLCRVPNDVSL